ncbi:GNAT family N-acetyltransferase [Nocardiopsis sp. NPDC058631]|uniref:GNAT family N-acetyltransferase n=1 Tax=Nocardiopsis sp. NPDC058631 TaxID=3346566 RepID=UPI00364F0C16
MNVREALPDEMAAVGELRVGAYRALGLLKEGDPYTDSLRALGTDGRGEVLVAAEGERVVGTILFVPWSESSKVARGPDEAEVRAFAVAPEAQGRGVGRSLVRAVAARASERGVSRLVLSTQPSMLAAQALYRAHGFTRTPERDWTPGPGVDLLTYALALPERVAAPRPAPRPADRG